MMQFNPPLSYESFQNIRYLGNLYPTQSALEDALRERTIVEELRHGFDHQSIDAHEGLMSREMSFRLMQAMVQPGSKLETLTMPLTENADRESVAHLRATYLEFAGHATFMGITDPRILLGNMQGWLDDWKERFTAPVTLRAFMTDMTMMEHGVADLLLLIFLSGECGFAHHADLDQPIDFGTIGKALAHLKKMPVAQLRLLVKKIANPNLTVPIDVPPFPVIADDGSLIPR